MGDEPLATRLQARSSTHPFLMFLMIHRSLRPGWDWLVERKLSSFWREIVGSPLEADMARFMDAAVTSGSPASRRCGWRRSRSVGCCCRPGAASTTSPSPISTPSLTACRQRQAATGQGWSHYRAALNAAHRVLFHLDVTDTPPPASQTPKSFE